ncbi:MAG: S-layer homology domain-containing protein [bacterium]|nr:S-layer homology domain-containing protein [bacterium]
MVIFRRFTSRCIILLLAFGFTVTPLDGVLAQSGSVFSDIQGHWAQPFIEQLVQQGIVEGRLPGQFDPDAWVDRAEVTKMALVAFASPSMKKAAASSRFPDIPVTAWYASYVAEARHMGVVQGYSDGMFHADQYVNRVEALKIVLGAAGVPLETSFQRLFADVAPGDWYASYVDCAVERGLMSPDGVGQFGAAQFVTRAEMTKLIAGLTTRSHISASH